MGFSASAIPLLLSTASFILAEVSWGAERKPSYPNASQRIHLALKLLFLCIVGEVKYTRGVEANMMKSPFSFAVLGLLAGAVSLPAQTPKLSGRELAGKKLFLQRCSICHMPPLNQPEDPDPKPYGPKLNGFVHDQASEERARQTILNGTTRMPGFQYGLTKDEIESILGYLKVFK